MKKNTLQKIAICLAIWVIASFTGSFIKQLDKRDYLGQAKGNNCGKTYPIDYILYTNLFCEAGNL